jgi:hypothetical protein
MEQKLTKKIVGNKVIKEDTVRSTFQKSELFRIIGSDSASKIDDAKAYIKKYFFKVLHPVCIYTFDAQTKRYCQITYDNFTQGYVTKFMTYSFIEGNRVVTQKFSDWFLYMETDSYNLAFEVSKPLTYKNDCGDLFLNLFQGFKYQNDKRPRETDKISADIQLIWDHIFNVICSENLEAFQYMQKWICHFINGRKMKTALYLKGVQGAGKSTLPTFLMNVIGNSNAYKTQTNSCLSNRFNGELQGIILLILEELKCASPIEWKMMNSSLNMITTENYISIEEKGKTPINIVNNISTIITSNDSAIRMDKNDRRYLMTDISIKKMDDVEYFNKVYSILNNEFYQKVFYFWCKDFAQKNEFNELAELKKIDSDAKTEVIIKHLHPFYLYLKNRYVLKKNLLIYS